MIRLSQSDSTESTVGDEKSKGSGWFRNVIQSTGGEKMWKASAFTLDFDDFVPTSLCAFCRVVVPTKPFTNTALYYKMLLESEPTPLATKCFWGFDGGLKANVGHYKRHLRNHFVVKNGLQWKIMIPY